MSEHNKEDSFSQSPSKSVKMSSNTDTTVLEQIYIKCSRASETGAMNFADMSLTKTREYRRDYHENVLIKLLCSGYHVSFSQIFRLINLQENGNFDCESEKLINNKEKLNLLVKKLKTSEKDYLEGFQHKEYHNLLELAEHFKQKKDKFLAHYFFQKCLDCAEKVENNNKIVSISHCNLALNLEDEKNCDEAIVHMNKFYHECESNKDWVDENGTCLFNVSANHLSRLYAQVSEKFKNEKDMEQCLFSARSSYEKALEVGAMTSIADASYMLGVALKMNNNMEESLSILNKYLALCESGKENRGAGRACLAIAQCYSSLEDYTKSIHYLEKYLEIAKAAKYDDMICDACSQLGNLYNILVNYDKAVEYFNEAYSIARSIDDNKTIGNSCVLFGVACGYRTLQKLSKNISCAQMDGNLKTPTIKSCYSAFTDNKISLNSILDWKDFRANK